MNIRRLVIAVAMVGAASGPVATAQSVAPFLTAGTYKLTTSKDIRFYWILHLSTVTSQGVTGAIESDPYSKCLGTFPITSSSVEADKIIVNSFPKESAAVPSGCERSLTLTRQRNGEIAVALYYKNQKSDWQWWFPRQ